MELQQQQQQQQELQVLIVGAGPAGLATSACLHQKSIPHIILEREDCSASLWKKRAYDRVNLHLAKEFCELPLMHISSDCSTYLSRQQFINYLDNYVSKFKLEPIYRRLVEHATYEEVSGKGKWCVKARNLTSDEVEVYISDFLVVATGENNQAYIPSIPGIATFEGELIHSNVYKSGSNFHGKEVLVIGCGNSGMEIAYDLSNHGASTSIVVRSPVHVLTKEMVHLAMTLLKYLPRGVVDFLTVMLAKLWFGDLSKYGLHRPSKGPFYLKDTVGRSPVLDVGTVQKIVKGDIQVRPTISKIDKDMIEFDNGDIQQFEAIIFATGYRSAANNWLKHYTNLLNNEGMPKNSFPKHWKGLNGLYCAGLSRKGLAGVSMDAQAIANDIKNVLIDDKKIM